MSTQLDLMTDKLVSDILNETYLKRETLTVMVRAFLKTMMDIKNIERSSTFKPTTLDWVAEKNNRNKFQANFWLSKVKMKVSSKAEMKELYAELERALQTTDFSSKRKRKAIALNLSPADKPEEQW